MTKFVRKTTTFRITTKKHAYSMHCDYCEDMNYIGVSADALGMHIYKIMVETLLSMQENNCTTIKISASWE